MRAIRFHDFGGPEVVRLEDVPRPTPRPDQLLIRVKAAGVNQVENLIREGKLPLPLQMPVTLGCDFAGTVEQGAGGLEAGDDVYGYVALTRNGTFADFLTALVGETAVKPKTLDYVHAAALPVAVLTAWQGIFDQGKLEPGQKILIHGGAGAVGSMAVQLAKWKGAIVVATASAENIAYLKDLGVERAIDYRKERFEDLTESVNLVFDTVGGEAQERSFAVLERGGILVSTVSPPSKEKAAAAGVTALMMNVQPDGPRLAEIAGMVDAGILSLRLDQTLPLERASEALEVVASHHAKGKLVLTVD